MKRLVWLFLILFGLAGCALPVRTNGDAGTVTWSTSAFDLSSGGPLGGTTDRFAFTLTLLETQNLALTLTAITWEVWQNGVDLSGRQMRSGTWSLPARGTLRQPFVYRIFCPSGDFCPDVGPTTQWDITFEGTDTQGQPVRIRLQPELPWIPPKRTIAHTAGAENGPAVELPAIDFTVPRLYYPRVGR